ncbi:SigE family RNA polymerase sigma factor [Actinocatenispora sera]|jgi:RNA polymerase sigma-70 factor (sigma-E family)|uniref:DNA-directed RNA polymerase sigma-70 factor n=1 Tax=Actinocatenispora sera TaxID=390989 RepID=A0A810KYV0_9ACTN|nr:SigE family RNA polymerase sigma factor [Actinocatenispora sera]BCJ27198.1 DNA-directed RNA polymerase sigma-70 factor [Actinocatenispora sera]
MRKEPDGFRDYVAARQEHLLGLARLLVGDWQRAEDLVQTALARVWPHWARVNASGDPHPYVRRVLINASHTAGRRRWRNEQPHAVVPESAAPTEDTELRVALERLLPTLPPRQRMVLVLRYYEDLPESAVAELLGCSVGTVKSQSSKALSRLRTNRLIRELAGEGTDE